MSVTERPSTRLARSPRPPARKISGVLSLFQPDPPAPYRVPAESVRALTRRWQIRILIGSMVGYAMFYFVRKNLSVAMPVMGKELGITKGDLGLFLTLHSLIYGLSKFANGFLGDRANARIFMAFGLVTSALMNVFFGLSSAVMTFGIFWMLNGWFQGMGFPPCARLMTHWFSPRELATKMSIWNTSHSIGAGAVVIVCGYLAAVNWRLCFFVPAGLAVLTSLALLPVLRDSPDSVGLPEPEGMKQKPSTAKTDTFGGFVMHRVFGNPIIWIIAVANFFVYSVRYAVFDWAPMMLNESKGIKIEHTGWMAAAFEISGIVGMLVSGWITDHIFGGRGSRTCLFYMALATAAVFVFWKLPNQSALTTTLLLGCAGFFIYGPQALVGIVVANLATKRAAATAVGLTGLFGYASGVVSGWGFGRVVDLYGWDAGYRMVLGLGVVGTVLFAAAWGAKPHGYAEEE